MSADPPVPCDRTISGNLPDAGFAPGAAEEAENKGESGGPIHCGCSTDADSAGYQTAVTSAWVLAPRQQYGLFGVKVLCPTPTFKSPWADSRGPPTRNTASIAARPNRIALRFIFSSLAELADPGVVERQRGLSRRPCRPSCRNSGKMAAPRAAECAWTDYGLGPRQLALKNLLDNKFPLEYSC
jgi:hypothetical protein